ncbi:MAG: hypothetical protein BWY83_00863 [bacterium ADurb.Bin478]|nr:MAG: hypothetical protein BWY83_00863 [bacterium ADurb.Bin478]
MSFSLRALISLAVLLGAAFGQEQKTVFEETYRVRDHLEFILRSDGGDVQIFRNDRNECSVQITYKEETCRPVVAYNERDRTLSIDVDHKNWSMLKSGNLKQSDYALIKIGLPHKPDLDLDVVVKAGKADLQLGDLHVRTLRMKSWAGETRLDFDRENRTELTTFDVNCKVGRVSLMHLGNARFQEADLTGSVGEMTVDFTGEKIKRAMARLDCKLGSTLVVVPEEVAVKIKVDKFLFLSGVDYPSWFEQRGNYYYSKNYDDKDESLYLIASTGIGEFKVRVASSE